MVVAVLRRAERRSRPLPHSASDDLFVQRTSEETILPELGVCVFGDIVFTPSRVSFSQSSPSPVNELAQVMAAEWSKYDIQCNTIGPTIVLTDMGAKAWG